MNYRTIVGLAGCFVTVVMTTCSSAQTSNQTLANMLIAERPVDLAADALRNGDPHCGAAIFYSHTLACATCHSVGERLESIGPDLSKLDPKTTDVERIGAGLENVI